MRTMDLTNMFALGVKQGGTALAGEQSRLVRALLLQYHKLSSPALKPCLDVYWEEAGTGEARIYKSCLWHALISRYIETDAEWRDMLSREFACKSESRLQRISKWRRDQASVRFYSRGLFFTFMRWNPSRASIKYPGNQPFPKGTSIAPTPRNLESC